MIVAIFIAQWCVHGTCDKPVVLMDVPMEDCRHMARTARWAGATLATCLEVKK